MMVAAAGIVFFTTEAPIAPDVPPLVMSHPSSLEQVILIAHIDTEDGPEDDLYKTEDGTKIPQSFTRSECEAYTGIVLRDLMRQLIAAGTSFTGLTTYCVTQDEFNTHVKDHHPPKEGST